MSYMKTENIKALNEKMDTSPDQPVGVLKDWVRECYDMMVSGECNEWRDEVLCEEVVRRLDEFEELKIRFKYLEKKHEDLYGRLSTFAEKLVDSLA